MFQILNEEYVITPAVHGMTAAILSGAVTLSGTPGTGEYASIIADQRHVYSRVGASASAILTAIAADAVAQYPSVSAVGNTITFPTSRLVCRIGAPATVGSVTHRQKHQFFVTVWTPNPTMRDTLAAAIDVAFKEVNHLTMPDTSLAVLCYDHANQIDEKSTVSIYRRDLVYSVEYATLQIYQAFEVTSVSPTIDGGGDGILTPVPRGARHCRSLAGAGRPRRQAGQPALRIVGRPAAARRHCPRGRHESESPAARRDHLGARP